MRASVWVSRLIHHFRTDTLFQNSIYLMLSTLVQAVFGFGFWLLSAHLYSAGQIGIASALISASTFIAYFSLLGFNSTFIRFLPTSKRRNDEINTGLLLVLAMSLILASAYIFALPRFAPQLMMLIGHNWHIIGFVLLSAAAAANLLTDSVFIAYRASGYNLLIYSIQSATKLALPVALIALGAFGVFAASGLAAAIALGLSLYFMARSFKYRPSLHISRQVIKQVRYYSSGNYLASLFNITPTLILPIVIVDRIGAAAAGYYYLAFMLANLIYTVAYSVAQALFAEVSHEENRFEQLLPKGAAILAAIMIPVALLLALAGPTALDVFGRTYNTQAHKVIVILALAAPVVAANVLGGVSLRISRHIPALVVSNLVYALTTCGLAFVWSTRGLTWVAGAWLVGNLVAAIISFSALAYSHINLGRIITARSN